MAEKQTEEKKEQDSKKQKTIIDKVIDFAFSNDERKWLIIILLFGAVLRFFAARNISLLGDEAIHGPHIIGFLHSGLISTFAHSPLWFYLGDIAIKFLGISVFSLRFLSFFYGTLSILLVYLIAKKIFNAKTGLISAFLLSISFFTIRYTLMEMDLAALFFLLVAVYAFILSMENKKFPWLAAVAIGLAGLIKTLSLFFVPAFLIAFFLFSKREENQREEPKRTELEVPKKKVIKTLIQIVLFGLIILAIFSPILAHNYFLCQDKGLIDVYFAKYFKDLKNATGFPGCLDLAKANEVYGMQLGYFESSFENKRFFEGVTSLSMAVFNSDRLIVILGLLGILLVYSLKEKRKYWFFLILFNLFGLLFLALTDWLTTHIVTMMPVICIFGGFFLSRASEDLSKKISISPKRILTIAILLILAFQFFTLWPFLSSECAMSKMRDYAVSNMDKNSIVITDSRIYTGRIPILFSDFHYIDAMAFSQLMQENQNLTNQIPVKIYYLECARDDCGWGTITPDSDLNKAMEQFTASFSQAPVIKTILGGGSYDEETGKPYFRVYSAAINLNPELISLIDSTHYWWYYPVNYKPKSQIFDAYNVQAGFDNLLYKLMWLITYASIAAAIILSFYPVYYLIKNKN